VTPKPASKSIAGLLGPSLTVMIASEFPVVQPHLYDAQIPPVVYLSGTLMFVAGLAIVRAHNHWRRDWTVLVTLRTSPTSAIAPRRTIIDRSEAASSCLFDRHRRDHEVRVFDPSLSER
jgi:hypothetical protein